MRISWSSVLVPRFLVVLFGVVLLAGTASAQILQEAYLKASFPDISDQFGHSVAISGDTLVVGAHLDDSNGTEGDNSRVNSGAAHVFVRDAGTGAWVKQAYLQGSFVLADDEFGYDVAIDGDTIVVGAWGDDAGGGVGGAKGAAYIFVRDEFGNWSQQAHLKATVIQSGARFGNDVAISGDTVVVGAWGDHGDDSVEPQGSGAAYVFVRTGATWDIQARLKASNPGSLDSFGRGITIDGDTIVVGAFSEDGGVPGVNGDQTDNTAVNAGAAYVFTRSGAVWSQQAYLKASNPRPGDFFGGRVSLSGDTLVSGASNEDGTSTDSGRNEGAAYVFVRDGSGTWSEQAYLKASDNSPQDRFGSAVSIEGNTLVVGAIEFGGAGFPGSAYVFTRSGTAWSEIQKLGASNPTGNDFFGFDVELSGSKVVVGALWEDGNTVDGPFNNDVSNAGAAYVFDIPGTTDTTPPVVTAPADIVGFEATNLFSNVPLGTATVTDNSGETLTAYALPDMSFALGDTTVTWSATDSAGNTGTDTQSVNVVDTTAPVVTAPADVIANAGAPIALGQPDIIEVVAVQSVSNDAPAGGFPLGDTTVTWTVTDSSANVGTDTQLVTVREGLNLTISSFRATGRARVSRGGTVSFAFKLKNVSNNTVDLGSATLVGTQDGSVVYTETLTGISDAPGGPATTHNFPPYTPGLAGTIVWEVNVLDGNADVDVATDTTRVVP